MDQQASLSGSSPVRGLTRIITAGGHEPSAVRRSAEAEVLDFMPDDDVEAALAELSEGARMAMFYVGVQGYTFAETAALMDVPMGTVMSRVSRGRRQLRVALARGPSTRFGALAGHPQVRAGGEFRVVDRGEHVPDRGIQLRRDCRDSGDSARHRHVPGVPWQATAARRPGSHLVTHRLRTSKGPAKQCAGQAD